MAIQNFNQVVDALNQFSNAHLSLKRFKTSFFEQIDNFATAENSFPILYVVPGDVNFEEQIDVMSFRVYCVDILQKDRSNEQSILNETLLVLRDLVNWIRETSTLDLNVVGTPRAVPINNFLTEFTVGFYIDLAVETSPETNDCSIPFSSNFQYSGITCDYTYVSQFLTCDTVASCQSIIDIQNQVNSLTGATDTYVTGFTYNDANRLTISQNSGQPPLNVFINTFTGITTNYLDVNTNVTETSAVGRLNWNDDDGTLNLGLKGGNVTLQIGQEQVVRVVNKTGADLLESQYKVARIRSQAEGGSQGQRLAIVLAQANNDANSVDTLGIVTENIDNNQEGFITTSGLVRGINTTGSLQSETWLDGDVLYLSPITAGELTKVKPIAPQHTVIMGYVVYAHVNNGKIFVKVDNGYELDELHNVRISGETNNQVLSYDSVQSVWVNRQIEATDIDPNVSNTEFSYLSGATSNIQNQINSIKRPITSLGDGTTVSGITTQAFSKALFIPANSRGTNDVPQIDTNANKIGSAGNLQLRFYWNTSPSLSGSPILIGTSVSTAANGFSISRLLQIEVGSGGGNGTKVQAATVSLSTSWGAITALQSVLPINWTIDGYLICALQNSNAADRSVCNMLKLN